MQVSHIIKTINKDTLSTCLHLPRKLVFGESIHAQRKNYSLFYKPGDFVSLDTFAWDHIIHTLIDVKSNEIHITEYFPDRLGDIIEINVSEGC